MAFSSRGSLALVLVSVGAAALVALPTAAFASVSNPSAKTVIAATTKAMDAANSVHVVATDSTAKQKSTLTADIGKASGTESYVEGKKTFTITVTPTYAYLSGSPSGLVDLMGLTKAEAKKMGSKSLSMKKGSTPYSTFEENLTSGAFPNLVPPAKGTTLLAKRDSKTGGYQLSWTQAKTSTTPASTTVMIVSAGAKTLPIDEKVTTSTGSSVTTFSNWGKNVTVKVPTDLIAYAKVFPKG